MTSQTSPASALHGAQPVFTTNGEAVFHRGVYLRPQDAEMVLVTFRISAKSTEWWARNAAELADELEAAMLVAGYIQRKAA